MDLFWWHELKAVCVDEIFQTVKSYTNKFETENEFIRWTKCKVNYT
jgi:hypothetical protein